MTKQEGIKEVIDAYTDDRCLYPDKGCSWCSKEGYCASGNDAYICLMKRLGELSVVVKVTGQHDLAYILKNDCDIVAVEPLVKE